MYTKYLLFPFSVSWSMTTSSHLDMPKCTTDISGLRLFFSYKSEYLKTSATFIKCSGMVLSTS